MQKCFESYSFVHSFIHSSCKHCLSTYVCKKAICCLPPIPNILCPPEAHHVRGTTFQGFQEAGSTGMKCEFLATCFRVWAVGRTMRMECSGKEKHSPSLGTSLIPVPTDLPLFPSMYSLPHSFLTLKSPSYPGLRLSLWGLFMVSG